MRRIIKSFTFWFFIFAIFITFMHQIGKDSKSIILIGLNPILNQLPYDFMNSGPKIAANTIAQEISIYWYIAFFFTMMLYGTILDLIKCSIKKRMQKK